MHKNEQDSGGFKEVEVEVEVEAPLSSAEAADWRREKPGGD